MKAVLFTIGFLCLRVYLPAADPRGTFTLALFSLPAADPYIASVEKWRQECEADLKADDGWLTVTGLF